MPEVTGPLVRTARAGVQINLTRLPADKKRKAWALIRDENPALAQLLQSHAFNTVKQQLENTFGPVDVLVNPAAMGGNEYGIRQRLKAED
ncbi:hypothetical protein HMF8227_02336 [Saliniradius amylolyticus]|uniref:Uncharacterized protein n=1 Tax=Saliniradius amylolyticus TaxID=2183582 RepID=A0A2S2E554_9ALTE|nr:hypothetical protein [Saliniradius amylolyticus]AWL12788.1 hypothetical protein HMF8227_02336 [Saliniradius amylolyticus]